MPNYQKPLRRSIIFSSRFRTSISGEIEIPVTLRPPPAEMPAGESASRQPASAAANQR